MSKQCPSCGALQNDKVKYCSVCGATLPEIDEKDIPPVYTEKTFYDRYASVLTKGSVIALAVMCFLTAPVALFNVFDGFYFALLDFALSIFVGVWMLVKKSWKCALVMVIYNALGTLISLIFFGTLGGYGVWIVGLLCVIRLRKGAIAYKKYKDFGELPMERF